MSAKKESFVCACQECGRALDNRHMLKAHMEIEHPEAEPVPYHKCESCGLAYDSKQGLLQHKRTEHGIDEKKEPRMFSDFTKGALFGMVVGLFFLGMLVLMERSSPPEGWMIEKVEKFCQECMDKSLWGPGELDLCLHCDDIELVDKVKHHRKGGAMNTLVCLMAFGCSFITFDHSWSGEDYMDYLNDEISGDPYLEYGETVVCADSRRDAELVFLASVGCWRQWVTVYCPDCFVEERIMWEHIEEAFNPVCCGMYAVNYIECSGEYLPGAPGCWELPVQPISEES